MTNLPASTAPAAAAHPNIQGRCPACRGASLFLGSGGYVTCSRLDCPNPCAADQLLHHTDPIECAHEAALGQAQAEVARLTAGEEPVTDPAVHLTAGQWIWEWNRAAPEARLQAAERVMRDTERASRCRLMAHEERLDEDRHAWVAVARVRDVLADMEQITGARHWARILRKAVDGVQRAPVAATEATEPPLVLPHDMATTLHRMLGQLLGDEDAQAIARVRALHQQTNGMCWECNHEWSVSWPCPTINALDGTEPTP